MPSKPVIRLREEILSFSHARESIRAEIRRTMQLRNFPLEIIGTFEQAAARQPGVPLEEARQFFDIEFTPPRCESTVVKVKFLPERFS